MFEKWCFQRTIKGMEGTVRQLKQSKMTLFITIKTNDNPVAIYAFCRRGKIANKGGLTHAESVSFFFFFHLALFALASGHASIQSSLTLKHTNSDWVSVWNVITKDEACDQSDNNCCTKWHARNPQIWQTVQVSQRCAVKKSVIVY